MSSSRDCARWCGVAARARRPRAGSCSTRRRPARAERGAVRVRGGRLVVTEALDGGGGTPAWVFAGRRAVEAPATAPALQGAARALAAGPERTLDVAASDSRLYAVPVVSNGRRVGTVVAAVSLSPYEQTQH